MSGFATRGARRGRSAGPRGLLVLAVVGSLALAACGSRVPQSPSSAAPSSTSSTSSGAGNTASDRGVTASQVTIGAIVGRSSPLGPDTFSASLYGAQAFVDELNAIGGVHGRTVKLVVCDDGGSGTGNVACAHKLVDDDGVFALAGVTAFQYDGAAYLNQKDVPDIGGQPIGSAYDQYPHLYSIYGGNGEPRDGKQAGWGGNLYAGTEVYRWFKDNVGAKTAAVVEYNIADSERFAQATVLGLKAEGYTVVEKQVAYGLPNYDAAVLDMRARGVDIVFDTLDDAGNAKLCQSMDGVGLKVKAKVTTVQSWTDAVRSTYAKSPTCRNSLYSTSQTLNYDDEQYPQVKQFRDAMAKYEPKAPPLAMWQLEGWASAQWLTDAMSSCGADLTRGCVEAYMDRKQSYDGHGLLTARNFVPDPTPPKTKNDCLNVARWQDSASGGKGGWVTQVKDMKTTCYDVPNIPYPAG